MIIAFVPWLGPVLKSLRLPGGLEFEFKDLERATKKAEDAGLMAPPSEAASAPEYSFESVAKENPVLGLAGLRIEIEKKLKDLSASKGIKPERPGIPGLLACLKDRAVLNQDERAALQNLVGLMNAAIHGEKVSAPMADWALDAGKRLLIGLEKTTGRP